MGKLMHYENGKLVYRTVPTVVYQDRYGRVSKPMPFTGTLVLTTGEGIDPKDRVLHWLAEERPAIHALNGKVVDTAVYLAGIATGWLLLFATVFLKG